MEIGLIFIKLHALIKDMNHFHGTLRVDNIGNFNQIEEQVLHLFNEVKNNNCLVECRWELDQLNALLSDIITTSTRIKNQISLELKTLNLYQSAHCSYHKASKLPDISNPKDRK